MDKKLLLADWMGVKVWLHLFCDTGLDERSTDDQRCMCDNSFIPVDGEDSEEYRWFNFSSWNELKLKKRKRIPQEGVAVGFDKLIALLP